MAKPLAKHLQNQPDIIKLKPMSLGQSASVFRILQNIKGKSKKRLMRVVNDISSPFALRREKGLLQFLNRYNEFARFYEIRKADNHYLQFFAHVGKRTLTKMVNKKGGLNNKKIRQLFKDMLRSIQCLNKAGFIHTQVSPDNIVYGKNGFVLINFSQALPELISYEVEKIPEDARFMAPERLNAEIGIQSDIYSLGCVLYFALTGKHPYGLTAETPLGDQLWAHTHNSIHKLNQLSDTWSHLIYWMMHKDPSKRPSIAELELWLDNQQVPEWVRNASIRAEKSFPEDAMMTLADQHLLYPIFCQAKALLEQGDLATAFNLFENGAFRDFSLAQVELGKLYKDGTIIEQSDSAAMKLFQQAMQRGNPDAAFELAKMLHHGKGIFNNPHQALKHYQYAANRGVIAAQEALAMMYWRGQATSIDLNKAYSWLRLAALSGSKSAQKSLKGLTEQISSSKKQKAK
jgi:serine/threonine protein kinase